MLIKTKTNIVLHTGDWKFKGARNLKEKPYINELKTLKNSNISTIVSDSTNSLINGYTPSENHAHNGLNKIISKIYFEILLFYEFFSQSLKNA